MNIIETGPTLRAELAAQRVIIGQDQLNKIIAVLLAHDHTKVIVPAEVSRTKLRVELASRTVPDNCQAVTAEMAQAGDNLLYAVDVVANADPVTREYWKAEGMQRANPMIAPMGALFGYDAAALDQLWIAADKR